MGTLSNQGYLRWQYRDSSNLSARASLHARFSTEEWSLVCLLHSDLRFTFEKIDAQSIPYRTDSFDAVIANHMLYHIPDLGKTLSEIRRVLKPEGHLYATTVGLNHMAELRACLETWVSKRRLAVTKWSHSSTLTTVPASGHISSPISRSNVGTES